MKKLYLKLDNYAIKVYEINKSKYYTSCRKCAFDSECMKNASRANVPAFGNDPCRGKNQICRKLECIWVEVK